MPALRIVLLALMLTTGAVSAQPTPVDASLAAARRFPQPVRVGDLIGRTVLQPLESRPVLGHVDRIIRLADGTLAAVIDYGGFFGVDARPIAVPIDGMTLAGADMEIVDFTPKQLAAFPTADAHAASLDADDTIRVGLSRPSH